MADSRLERIAQYLVAQIDADGKPEGLLVDRQRTLPLDETTLPAVVVYFIKETAEKIAGRSTVVRRRAVFRIEKRVAGEPTDQKLEPLRQWVVAQLMADFSLGGLAKEIDEMGSQCDQIVKDIVVGAEATDFEVTYYTQVNDLTS
jgi:hypothetical protein